MKRIGCMVLALLFAVSLAACGISVSDEEPAVLTWYKTSGAKTATLTAEETERVEEILEDADYIPGGAGCPFKNLSISFGEREIAISTDGCNTALDKERERYYQMSGEDYAYILSLFVDYLEYSL